MIKKECQRKIGFDRAWAWAISPLNYYLFILRFKRVTKEQRINLFTCSDPVTKSIFVYIDPMRTVGGYYGHYP